MVALIAQTHEYYLDKENVISSEHLGMNFMGNASKNLIKKEVYGTSINTYTYEFDRDNHVTRQTETMGGSSYSITFTWK